MQDSSKNAWRVELEVILSATCVVAFKHGTSSSQNSRSTRVRTKMVDDIEVNDMKHLKPTCDKIALLVGARSNDLRRSALRYLSLSYRLRGSVVAGAPKTVKQVYCSKACCVSLLIHERGQRKDHNDLRKLSDNQ